MLLLCVGAAGRAAASASPHHVRSTRRRCSPLCTARCCWGTERCFWAPAGPGGLLWSPALCLKGREGALLVWSEIMEIRKRKKTSVTFQNVFPFLFDSLMKVFQACGSSLCLQAWGQPITTVLGFIPPRPLDCIMWLIPSRGFWATIHWQKPFTRSLSIRCLRVWNRRNGLWKVSFYHLYEFSRTNLQVTVFPVLAVTDFSTTFWHLKVTGSTGWKSFKWNTNSSRIPPVQQRGPLRSFAGSCRRRLCQRWSGPFPPSAGWRTWAGEETWRGRPRPVLARPTPGAWRRTGESVFIDADFKNQ